MHWRIFSSSLVNLLKLSYTLIHCTKVSYAHALDIPGIRHGHGVDLMLIVQASMHMMKEEYCLSLAARWQPVSFEDPGAYFFPPFFFFLFLVFVLVIVPLSSAALSSFILVSSCPVLLARASPSGVTCSDPSAGAADCC
jgi:hypothetical protein